MSFIVLDMEQYKRKDHFDYFRTLAFPYAGTTVNVDITEYLRSLKACGRPFFLSFLYEAAAAANSVQEFRQRIKDGGIIEYDWCNTSHTVMKEDGTYSYCELNSRVPFEEFLPGAIKQQEQAKLAGDIGEEDSLSLFFISTMPWLSYASLIQPVPAPADSNPRITWGKYFTAEGRTLLPVSVLVNHALADGRHISQFYEALEKRLSRAND